MLHELMMIGLKTWGTIILIVLILLAGFFLLDRTLLKRKRQRKEVLKQLALINQFRTINEQRAGDSFWQERDNLIFDTVREFDDELARDRSPGAETHGGQLPNNPVHDRRSRDFNDRAVGW